jgi:serine/threonine-protein kinase
MLESESRRVDPTLKATLVGGVGISGSVGLASVDATLGGVGDALRKPIELDETVDGEAVAAASTGTGARTVSRGTVLPRRKAGAASERPAAEERVRFERVRLLGEGAVGEVELARDNDIRRTVAVKRLQGGAASEAALLRFADEIRIVGQLEHPGIVPIYDVGRDDAGQVYLVMKHLQGETMEAVIDKVRTGVPGYRERFTVEQRAHLFLGVLDAVRYAHARGVIHRDLKPANVMIGPYGEVTVLDWGIAKPLRGDAAARAEVRPLESTLVESHDQRLLETQFGSLAGTPLYMSPEQAAGRNDELDERSDIYSLCVLLWEWLALVHPLETKQTVSEVLAATISHDYSIRDLNECFWRESVPMEFAWLVLGGLARDRDRRYQSVADLEDRLQRALGGRAPVQCHVTFVKRVAHGGLRWIDRNAGLFSILVILLALGLVAALGFGAWRLAHALR